MSFIWPAMLFLLLLLPLGVALYLRLQQRRQRTLAQSGGFGLALAASGQQLGARRHIPPALFLAGLALLLIGLARPQTTVSLPKVEGTVILTFDVSGSMAAEDVAPNRMEAAKAVAREFVQRQPTTVQIGVVAFSDGGLAVQAPTNDQEEVLAAIARIGPQRGTSLGQGMLVALNTIAINDGQEPLSLDATQATPTPGPPASNRSAVIVLLSDGENTAPPEPLEVAQAAFERSVRIYTVGIGSAAGTTLAINGFNVFTQLDEAALQQIAQLTGGGYYNAANQQNLEAIYENLDLQLVIEAEQSEISALFAGAGMLLFLVGAACSLLWFSRAP